MWPTPTYYLWGESGTCLYGRIWNISDRAGTNPEGLLQHFRVDIDTRVGPCMLILVALVTFSLQDRVLDLTPLRRRKFRL